MSVKQVNTVEQAGIAPLTTSQIASVQIAATAAGVVSASLKSLGFRRGVKILGLAYVIGQNAGTTGTPSDPAAAVALAATATLDTVKVIVGTGAAAGGYVNVLVCEA